MSPCSVLITGANRGIGFQLVLAYASLPDCSIVIATCRDRAASNDLVSFAESSGGKVVVLDLDVTALDAFPAFVEKVGALVGDAGLNLLINNAGYLPTNFALDKVTPEDMRRAYEVNCIGPLFLARSLLPLVQRAADAGKSKPIGVSRAGIVHVSTSVASVAENTSGARTGGYAYRCSKSGLNQMMKTMAVDLAETGILILSMHPGWVQTDMGGPNALITAEHSARSMMESLSKLGADDHGAFRRYDNTTIRW